MTAAMSGVVPKNDSNGANERSNRIKEKNPAPVRAKTVGVTSAAVVQPNLWKMNRPRIIMTNVVLPVAVLKLPCVRRGPRWVGGEAGGPGERCLC